jgi:hypothetical protein
VANEASNWGGFQVLGENWQRLHYPSVEDFVDSTSANGDDRQMNAFVAFIEADPALHASLTARARLDVERRYNGGGQGGAYAAKLQSAVATYDTPAAARAAQAEPRARRHRAPGSPRYHAGWSLRAAD